MTETKHSPEQQYCFLRYLQNGLDDPHLRQALKKREKGLDIKVQKRAESMPDPLYNKQDLLELLYAYLKLNDIKGSEWNTLDGYIETIEETADSEEVKQRLNRQLKTLMLPTI